MPALRSRHGTHRDRAAGSAGAPSVARTGSTTVVFCGQLTPPCEAPSHALATLIQPIPALEHRPDAGAFCAFIRRRPSEARCWARATAKTRRLGHSATAHAGAQPARRNAPPSLRGARSNADDESFANAGVAPAGAWKGFSTLGSSRRLRPRLGGGPLVPLRIALH